MSSSSREVTGKKKKDVWQEAGGEFYQERYPGGSGQAASNADLTETTERHVARTHIPLPSQTARRNSFIPTGRRYFTRKPSMTATFTATNCMTYTSTMGGVVANGNDVHVALMPDLSDETIPNEKTTYEALHRLKTLPESMTQKRLRKAKIIGIPQLRLTGWRRVKWDCTKAWKYTQEVWHHEKRRFRLFQNSLQLVEVRCGTSIVNVFLFIKWTLLMNLFVSTLISIFIILPYMGSNSEVVAGKHQPGDDCTLPVNETIYYKDQAVRVECCTKEYQIDIEDQTRGSLGLIMRLVFDQNWIEVTPLFFGYYIHVNADPKHDLFAVSYVLVFIFILGFCLVTMVRHVALGFQEMIMAWEGGHSQYTNLAFSGWDHYTRDDTGANFKKKILHHEIKVALQSENLSLEALLRNKRERMRLNTLRVVINFFVLFLLLVAGLIIFFVSGLSLERRKGGQKFNRAEIGKHLKNLGISFLPSIIISFFNIIFPIVLTKLGKLEKYSVQTETSLVLFRALFIRLMSIGFLAVKFYLVAICDLENNDVCVKCKIGKDKKDYDQRHCWESLVADQIYRLMVVDLAIKCILTFMIDPLRLQMKRLFKCKICQRIGSMKFSIVRHSLDVIYIQVLSWIGMYFGPIIPILGIVYCYLVFYMKKYSVLHNCTAVPDTFRTMKTTAIFVAAKLLAFFVVIFANASVIGYTKPSRGCGPFRNYEKPWEAVNEIIKTTKFTAAIYEHIASPGITTPLVMCLLLTTYYYYAVAHANRGMVDTLRHLLILEGHDKQYLFARLNSLRRPSPTNSESDASHINVRE